MSRSWPAILRRFRDLDVLVIDDAMLDTCLQGSAGRLCQGAPVPTVSVQRRTDAPGGAANTALNVRTLGVSTSWQVCHKSVCPEGHQDCRQRVPPESVVDAALALLP